MIDEKDASILNIVQTDGRASLAMIGREVGLATSAVLHRLRRLKENGYVHGFTVLLDAERLGLGTAAFITVRTEESPSSRDVGAALARIEQVLEVHDVAGEECYLLRVMARDIHDLKTLVREHIGVIPGVRRTSTTIILETLKQTRRIDARRGLPQKETV